MHMDSYVCPVLPASVFVFLSHKVSNFVDPKIFHNVSKFMESLCGVHHGANGDTSLNT